MNATKPEKLKKVIKLLAEKKPEFDSISEITFSGLTT